MLPAVLLAGLGCSAGAPAPQFQPQPIRGTLAQVWTIPSGCPSTLVTPSHTKGATFWANDTLWATYLRTRDADAQLLKRSLGGSPNATAIIGFELYLADSAVWGPEPLQRLALAIAHWRTRGIRPLLFLLDIEFSGKGTWSTTHDVVHDPQARAYLLSAVRTVLGAEGVSREIEFVSAYWVGASARCNGRASVCTEADITALIGDLQRIANDIGGATYLQHVDGPFWNSPGQNVSGYSARSLGQAQGVMAESWTMGTLAKGVGSLLAAGGATRDTLLLLNDVPNCDLDPTRPCSTGSVGSDTATWFGWLDQLGLGDTWGVWDFVDGGAGDVNGYGDVTNDGSALTAKGRLHRQRALATLSAPAAGRTWFLRPSAAKQESRADGKSYTTAWTEVSRVTWQAIQPGDTLFVCGLGSGPFNLPAGFSGAEGAEVTIDGSCPRPDGSVDQALWIGGDLINPFPAEWSGPDKAGIYSSTYAGSASYGLAAAPNASGMGELTRLRRGACDASGPVNVSSWPADAFCAGPRTGAPTEAQGLAKVFYKPSSRSTPADIFGNLLGVLVTANNSDVTIANMRMAFGARLLDVNGGARVTLRNNSLKWASDEGISFNAKAGHAGSHPGTQGALVTRNRIEECACGLYIVNQNDSAPLDAFPNYADSNDLVVSWNNFTDIDQENFYGNRDTHAIGIQGGVRNVYEHNRIVGVGGSGITFYQGPGQLMEDNVARYNTVLNVRDVEGKKNQRGIEFCDDNRAGNRTDTNNSVYFNVLANITNVALRSKSRKPATPRGGPGPLENCGWRFLNNVVVDAGVGFELEEMEYNPDPQGSCFINNIVACGLGERACGANYRHQVGVPRNATVLSNNLYFPDNGTYFCEGSGSCTAFVGWAEKNSRNAGNASQVADPQFTDPSRWPDGLRPKPGSPAAAHGRPVGLSFDFAGKAVPSAGAVPSVGAFQIAAKHDDLLPSPTSTAAPPTQQQHLKWLSFYDYNATEQHTICNLGMHQSLDRLLAGFAKYPSLPGMLDVADVGGGQGLYWVGSPHPYNTHLNPQWRSLVGGLIDSALPHLRSGAIRGIFMGDEPCCGGLPPAELEEVASFVKAKIEGTGAFIAVNECERSFSGLWLNQSSGKWQPFPGLIKQLPHAIDFVSADLYTYAAPGEAAQAQKFYTELIYPTLSAHQKTWVVPGLFADSTQPVNVSDGILVEKLQGYWQWVQKDTRVVGLIPWHWDSRYPRPVAEKLGAREFPVLRQKLEEIAAAIRGGTGGE